MTPRAGFLRESKLGRYSTVAGVALATGVLPQEAGAAATPCNPEVLGEYAAAGDTYLLDFDGVANNEISMKVGGLRPGGTKGGGGTPGDLYATIELKEAKTNAADLLVLPQAGTTKQAPYPLVFVYPGSLGTPSTVGPTAPGTALWYRRGEQAFVVSSSGGPQSQTVYLGFQFPDSIGSTNLHHGWLRLTAQATGSTPDSVSITIDECAYETEPNTPIAVGTVPVELQSFSVE
jgi:hypothetical protein